MVTSVYGDFFIAELIEVPWELIKKQRRGRDRWDGLVGEEKKRVVGSEQGSLNGTEIKQCTRMVILRDFSYTVIVRGWVGWQSPEK